MESLQGSVQTLSRQVPSVGVSTGVCVHISADTPLGSVLARPWFLTITMLRDQLMELQGDKEG